MVSPAGSVSFSSVLVFSAHRPSPMVAWSVRAPVSAVTASPVISIFCTHCGVIVNIACEEAHQRRHRLKQAASAGVDAKVLALRTRGSKTFSRFAFTFSCSLRHHPHQSCVSLLPHRQLRFASFLVHHLANEKFGVIFTLPKHSSCHLCYASSELLPARA